MMVNFRNFYWIYHGCFSIMCILNSMLCNLDEILASLDHDDPKVKSLAEFVEGMRCYYDFESWFLNEK